MKRGPNGERISNCYHDCNRTACMMITMARGDFTNTIPADCPLPEWGEPGAEVYVKKHLNEWTVMENEVEQLNAELARAYADLEHVNKDRARLAADNLALEEEVRELKDKCLECDVQADIDRRAEEAGLTDDSILAARVSKLEDTVEKLVKVMRAELEHEDLMRHTETDPAPQDEWPEVAVRVRQSQSMPEDWYICGRPDYLTRSQAEGYARLINMARKWRNLEGDIPTNTIRRILKGEKP